MGFYLARSNYTAESWGVLIGDPQDRSGALRQAAESVGLAFHGMWYSLQEPHGYALFEGDELAITAFEVAVAASGSVSSIDITPLLTPDEMVDALRRASSIDFRSPGESEQ